MARVPAIMLASMLLGSSGLRRKSNRSTVNATLQFPQGCEGHTQAAPAGWAVQCDTSIDSLSSGLKPVKNLAITTYDYCWQLCREHEGCAVIWFNQFLGTACKFFEIAEDQGGLCFKDFDRPGSNQAVYYNAELVAPNPNPECLKVDPGPSCEEHQALNRPGWNAVSCDQGVDYDKMSGAKWESSGSSYISCQVKCERVSDCLGIEVRIRESFPYSWNCGLLKDRSRYVAGQEEPLALCTKAKPPFPYTKHHVVTLTKRSFTTPCTPALS